ncbi:hypothetical protein [Pelagicoccus sp. SDUM812003]|uniref:hypothetical protein n=1 Tax=Pelagicoccus sp. SDUM812003 TaxID=3041267 RepID=UPI00281044DF|nr:hypothetical protein [Pelagicoccus sp. SDUM812003]MDQ8203419.1 hypothetical protein [Pelagicoccus sp. SDUM812003]
MTQNTIDPQQSKQLADIEAFEQGTGYDATYLKEMLTHAPEALEVFNGFLPMAGHRKHAPLEAYYVAKLSAYRIADCGPCLQLAVTYAKHDGVRKELIESVALQGKPLTGMNLAVQRFTRAVLANEPELADLRKELVFDLGEAAVIEIALAIAAAQVFPLVKRAMGRYQSCQMISLEL